MDGCISKNRPILKRGFKKESKRKTLHLEPEAYGDVCEDEGSGSTYKLPLEVEFRKRSNIILQIIRDKNLLGKEQSDNLKIIIEEEFIYNRPLSKLSF
ncbi:MAG: palindromic element RPE1 domain-containing protein [Rickettsia endosymbiont of Argas persicus]